VKTCDASGSPHTHLFHAGIDRFGNGVTEYIDDDPANNSMITNQILVVTGSTL
jgi:hypothetical protein